MANLLMHCGGKHITRDELANATTPLRTRSWVPIAHQRLLELVDQTIEGQGFHVTNQAHGLWGDGDRYFGLMELANGHTEDDYGLVLGLRNSHDKTFPASLALGSQVLVCDNLSFFGEVVLTRRHTRFIERDLPWIVAQAVGRLSEMRTQQADRLDAYKQTRIQDRTAHDLMVRAVDTRVIPVTQLPLVLKSDNGSAFQSRAWERLLAKWQVIPLYSPPRTPRYNGGCEAGNGSMKVRTTMLAAANNRGGRWSCDDLEGARQQANELTRRDKPTTPTSAQRWSLRTRFETEDRLRFQIALDEQREKVHNQTVEGVGDKPPTLHEKARDERKAVTQALQELRLLSVTWRSVSLPISAKKVASIM